MWETCFMFLVNKNVVVWTNQFESNQILIDLRHKKKNQKISR